MTEQEILSKLTSLCSAAEHCTGEMKEKMHKWDVDEDTQQRVIDYLVKEQYVDDERYCRMFVREKIRFNKWGRMKVEQALCMKHIPSSVSRPILDEVPDEDYKEVLIPLLQSKERTIKAKDDYEKGLKLIRFAMGRGFDLDLIKECLTEIV